MIAEEPTYTFSEFASSERSRQERESEFSLSDLHFGRLPSTPSGFITLSSPSFDSISAQIFAAITQITPIAKIALSAQLREKISELAQLPENWDGEGAKQVKWYILANVVGTLIRLKQESRQFHEPFLAPTFDGFIQLDWHGDKRGLEIQATDSGWEAVGTSVGASNARQYYTAEFDRNDFGQIRKLYLWLLGDELIWPFL